MKLIDKDALVAEIERLQEAIKATAIDDRISKEQAEAYKVCVKIRNFVDDVEFEQQQEPTSDHWQEVRERVAMMALPSIIPMKKGLYSICDAYKKYTDCAEEAIRYADALVKILKGG